MELTFDKYAEQHYYNSIYRFFFCFHSPHDLSSIRAFMFLDETQLKKVGGPPHMKTSIGLLGGGAIETPLER